MDSKNYLGQDERSQLVLEANEVKAVTNLKLHDYERPIKNSFQLLSEAYSVAARIYPVSASEFICKSCCTHIY